MQQKQCEGFPWRDEYGSVKATTNNAEGMDMCNIQAHQEYASSRS